MMNKDNSQIEALKLQLTDLQIRTHQQDHELMNLRVHAARQDALLHRLLNLVGLLSEDINGSDALTTKDKSLFLRVRRSCN